MRTRLAVRGTDSEAELSPPSPRSKHQTPGCCVMPGPPPHSPHPNSPRDYCKGCFGTYPADAPARSSKSQSRPLMLKGLDLSIANRFLAPRTRRRAGHYNETRLAREAAGLTSSVKHGSHGPENPGSLPEVVVLSESSFLWWTCLGPPTISRIQQLPDDDKNAYKQAWGNVLEKTRLSPVCKRFMNLWNKEAERLLESRKEIISPLL
ncbi:hypothetical protein FB567DRAFT_543533 [Paraphoma chrysanthemicola]|uniref:Uncharacterized protein n=1 Tax=Paraphoma chrysanthemicola TaxID=798071 RepID=A0A8K0RHL1_9PLEO|nr:hypothetical protein FB567DRAFT_543533 [Paraphoma chrysanthemicola]